jgi:hypothetical protein
MTHDFENPEAVSASSDSAENFKYEREDWTLFRTLDGLTQKAGVSRDELARLAMKELVDNALDAGTADVGRLSIERGYLR